MTNKLLEVGKRYRFKEPLVVTAVGSNSIFVDSKVMSGSYGRNEFFELFEELPPIDNLSAKYNWFGSKPRVETNPIDSQKEEDLREEDKDFKFKVGYIQQMQQRKAKMDEEAKKLRKACGIEESENFNWFPSPENQVKDRPGINKPTSIWKDVSDLPEDDYEILIKKVDEEIELQSCSKKYGWANKEDTEKYCKLTDFINEHIQLKEDIEELKKLIKTK